MMMYTDITAECAQLETEDHFGVAFRYATGGYQLNITHRGKKLILKHFPNLFQERFEGVYQPGTAARFFNHYIERARKNTIALPSPIDAAFEIGTAQHKLACNMYSNNTPAELIRVLRGQDVTEAYLDLTKDEFLDCVAAALNEWYEA